MPTDAGGWTPDWPVQGVGAWMSTRTSGFSSAPFDSLNMGTAVGDDPEHVQRNRSRFTASLDGATPVFLKQVHGTRVVRLTHTDLLSSCLLEADASFTTEPFVACTVQVADCLPVLLAAPGGRAVAAAHAGWRGLAAGVLEATVREVCHGAACEPNQLQAWLGPCIGPERFEVGADVREAFRAAPGEHFSAPFQRAGLLRYWANLPALAHWRLHLAGVPGTQVHGGTWCTVKDASRFFSFRRDGVTGRLAAAIWRVA